MKEPAKEKIKKIFALAPFFSANTAFSQFSGQYIPVPSMDGFKAGKSMAELHAQEPFPASARYLPEEKLRYLQASSFTDATDTNNERSFSLRI